MTATPNTAALHPTCETCRHWANSNEWDTPPGFKRCNRAPMTDEVWVWDHEQDRQAIALEHADTMMCAMDGSSYKADVHTRGDFYCPMHSALAAAVTPANEGGV